MKKIVFILFCIVAIYFIAGPSKLDTLMDEEMPFFRSSNSGFSDVDPDASQAKHIKDFSEPGLITVVEFFDEKCSACTTWMMPKLKTLNTVRPDVSIKLIHMTKNYYRFWGEKYGLDVPHIPFTVLLDKQGEIIVADDGQDDDGVNMLIEWINAELKRDWEKKNHR